MSDLPDEAAFYTALGRQVRDARAAAGYTQEQLGAYLGLTRSSVSNIESGRQGMTVFTLAQLHGLIGLPLRGLVPDVERVPNPSAELTAEVAALRCRIRGAIKVLQGCPPVQPEGEGRCA